MAKVILLTDFTEEYARLLMKGIVEYTKEHEPWELCKMPLSYRVEHGIEGVLKWALEWKADAIIAQFYPSDDVSLFTQNNIIAIAQDFKQRFSNIPNITGNHHLAGKMGAQYFIQKGFNNFAFYGYREVIWSDERFEGFKEELSKSNLDYNLFEYQNTDFKDLWYYEQEPLTLWLHSLPKPIAIMASDDNQAHNIIQICINNAIKIPEDIAVLGVDNDETVCMLSIPPLSSINQDVEKGGYETACMIERILKKQISKPYDIIVEPTHIKTRNSTDTYATSNKHIQKIVKYIHQNTSDKISVEDIVQLVPMSRRLVEIKFKEVTGDSIYNYILNLRIEKFSLKLVESDEPIVDIAMDFGFSDYKNISRQFKKVKGYTPLEYRNKYSHKAK